MNKTTLTQHCFWIQGANIDPRTAQKNCRRGEKQFQDSLPKNFFTNLCVTFQNPHVPALKTREPKTGVEVNHFGSERNVVVETHSKK